MWFNPSLKVTSLAGGLMSTSKLHFFSLLEPLNVLPQCFVRLSEIKLGHLTCTGSVLFIIVGCIKSVGGLFFELG